MVASRPDAIRTLPLGAVLAVMVGCGGGPGAKGASAPAGCPAGDVELVSRDALAAFAGCEAVGGDLTVRGAALTDLGPLATLRQVGGTLHLGGTLRLRSATGLGRLERVGGDLVVRDNADLEGLFLGALVYVGGDLVIEGNFSLRNVALHRLGEVKGGILLARNGALDVVDLGSLTQVGGRMEVSENRVLERLVLPALSGGGEVEMFANPALEGDPAGHERGLPPD